MEWLKPSFQEKHQLKNQQSYITVLADYQTYIRNNSEYQLTHDNSTACNIGWKIYKDNVQTQKSETSKELIKASLSLVAVLVIEAICEPQFNFEEQHNSSMLNNKFSSKTDLLIFKSFAPNIFEK